MTSATPTFEFEDATPVTTSKLGRPVEPNPFTDVVKAIALQHDENGLPIAKKFTITHPADEEAKKKEINRFRTLFSAAGRDNDPAVTVRISPAPRMKGPKGREVPSETETVITFWTVERQHRPRKSGTVTADVATTETAAEPNTALSPVE